MTQPFTRYSRTVDFGGKPTKFTWENDPRSQAVCHQCGRRRWAKYLTILVCYDTSIVSCVEGHRWDGRRRRFVTKEAA